jgi:hypothetical protein
MFLNFHPLGLIAQTFDTAPRRASKRASVAQIHKFLAANGLEAAESFSRIAHESGQKQAGLISGLPRGNQRIKHKTNKKARFCEFFQFM